MKLLHNIKFLIISCLSIFIFLSLSNLFISGTSSFDIIETLLIIAFLWIGCALIAYILNRKYTWQKHTLIRLLLHSSLIVFISFLGVLVVDIIPLMLNKEILDIKEIKINFMVMVLICFTVSAIAEAKDVIKAWKETLIKTNNLEKENILAQYNVLKSQVDPHFLFNSLNTLATYAQDIPEINLYVKNLSEYLRYTLTLKEDLLNLISEELNIVNRYLYLQKARFKDNLKVDINIPKKVIDKGYVPTFCIQMLVENALKHNIISKNKPLTIKIYECEGHIIVENNLQEKETFESTKIGLKNITERYNLSSDKKVLIEKKNAIFKVSLPIIENINL